MERWKYCWLDGYIEPFNRIIINDDDSIAIINCAKSRPYRCVLRTNNFLCNLIVFFTHNFVSCANYALFNFDFNDENEFVSF